MVVCCVPYCGKKGTKMFYSFPRKLEIRKEWINKTNRTEEQLNSFSKVCKYHFRETDFKINGRGQKALKENTIPSLNLPELRTDSLGMTEKTVLLEIEYVDAINNAEIPTCSNEEFDSKERQNRKRKPTESIDDLLTYSRDLDRNVDLKNQEAELVDPNKIPVNVDPEEYERMAKQCKINEKRIKEYEKKSVKEFKLREKTNKLTISRLTKLNHDKKEKLKNFRLQQKINKNNVMDYLSKFFNPEQLEFFGMQMKKSKRKPISRRYTSEQKSLCLVLYKHGPRNYRHMRNIFVLPSKRTLGRHSARLVFHTGINSHLFSLIKEKVKDLSQNERSVALLWDEISLKAHLDYDPKRDVLDGFVDFSDVRRPTFATNALTFMIRGIAIPFKQPVAFYFTEGLKALSSCKN